MSEEMNKESESKRFRFNQEEVVVPDLAEVWKELYYSTEKAWAEAFKDFISTDTFVNMLDKTLEQYLAYEKMSRESIDKYCEMNPMASKKDIARVAELVVSMEDKLDDMEFQLFDNIRVIADNMLKIVNIQDSFRSGLEDIRTSFASLEERLKSLGEQTGLAAGQGSVQPVESGRTASEAGAESGFQAWNAVNDQLAVLTRSVQQLSNLDIDKAYQKMDALEKKVDALGKELKPARKRSKAEGTDNAAGKDAAREQK